MSVGGLPDISWKNWSRCCLNVIVSFSSLISSRTMLNKGKLSLNKSCVAILLTDGNSIFVGGIWSNNSLYFSFELTWQLISSETACATEGKYSVDDFF